MCEIILSIVAVFYMPLFAATHGIGESLSFYTVSPLTAFSYAITYRLPTVGHHQRFVVLWKDCS